MLLSRADHALEVCLQRVEVPLPGRLPLGRIVLSGIERHLDRVADAGQFVMRLEAVPAFLLPRLVLPGLLPCHMPFDQDVFDGREAAAVCQELQRVDAGLAHFLTSGGLLSGWLLSVDRSPVKPLVVSREEHDDLRPVEADGLVDKRCQFSTGPADSRGIEHPVVAVAEPLLQLAGEGVPVAVRESVGGGAADDEDPLPGTGDEVPGAAYEVPGESNPVPPKAHPVPLRGDQVP